MTYVYDTLIVYVYDMFLAYDMNFMYMIYVVSFSLLGIRLIPLCLYVQENSYGSGKVLGSLGLCIDAGWNRWTERLIRG